MGTMQLEILAPMLVMLALIFTVGGVLVLRPIAKRLGDLFEVMTRERLEGTRREDTEHIRDLLETMNQRLALIEEKQDFTDRLLHSAESRPAGRSGGAADTGP